jgi:hypothetical protein
VTPQETRRESRELNNANSSFAQGQRHYSACYYRILSGRTPKRLPLNEGAQP